MSSPTSLERPRLRPLAARTTALFALSAPLTTLAVNTAHVSNCTDMLSPMPGSLRAEVLAANSGDTVLIDQLPAACNSTITLRTGAITLTNPFVTISGPAGSRVTISGKYNGIPEQDRIISSSSYLTLENLNIVGGSPYSSNTLSTLRGGCISVAGGLRLKNSTVALCTAGGNGADVLGGGVYVNGDAYMRYVSILDNTAGGPAPHRSAGGGVFVTGTLTMSYSTVSGNAVDPSGTTGSHVGGGLYVQYRADIIRSTISGNTSGGNVGGIEVEANGGRLVLSDSTVAYNHAPNGSVGGILAAADVYLTNSTIAFNTAATAPASTGTGRFAPGLTVSGLGQSLTAQLFNSLLSHNSYGATQYDFSVLHDSTTTVTVSGTGNLIHVTSVAMPAGNPLIGACPLLGRLRDNGGTTLTQALLSHSPGIDAGTNAQAYGTSDQRGPPYTRISPSIGTVDIGAYEVQQDDIVFNASFEGCP